MISLILSALFAVQGFSDITKDPVYKELSKLVGGRWESVSAPGVKVVNRFRFEVSGTAIRSQGIVTVSGKDVLHMHANFGWDSSTKSVYYIDFHNNDTVFSGHVTLMNGSLVLDFGELFEPKHHYKVSFTFLDNDHYNSLLNGSVQKMTRIKE